MKKLKLFIRLWFTMFSVAVFAQAEFEKIAITQNTQDNLAGRLLVQDVTTGEIRYILKSVLDNKFNQPTGNATQYLDGAGNPTTFPVLGQSDRVITEVRNTTGATVTKGTVVYLTGASGGKPTIQKAQANAESTSSGTFGVIQSDINNNSKGYAVVIGTVLGVNTSSYTEGQVLWLSPTVAGGFTSTKPVAPNHAVYVAIVTLASTQGTIEVKIQNGYEIDELHDVLITSKANNDAIVYDSASGLWKNRQLVSDAITDGVTTVAPSQNAVFDALTAKENTSSKNVANGYAGLGSDGKLFSTQLPSITITDTFVVGSQAAMLALIAETGDVAVRTDVNNSFILQGDTPSDIADWQELLTPTSTVSSVFGRTGAVTSNSGDYTADQISETASRKFQTLAQQTYNDATSSIQTQLNAKATDSNTVHKTGDENIAGIKTFSNLTNFSGSGIKINTNGWVTPNQVYGETGNFFVNYSGNGNTIIGNSTGNVGIGTTSPLQKLVVDGGSADFTPIFAKSSLLSGGKYFGSLLAGYQTDVSKSVQFGYAYDTSNIANSYAHITTFGASEGSQFAMKPNGNVGIGTTSPAQKLDVNGAIASVNEIFINGSGNTNLFFQKSGVNKWIAGYVDSISAFRFSNGSSDVLTLSNGGNVGIGTISPSEKLQVAGNVLATGFFQSSDLRLKDIISRDGDVIKYKWKDKRDDKIHIGYVAQEVQKENPDQVNADDKGILSVNYIEILVQKIKDLENRIKQLEK